MRIPGNHNTTPGVKLQSALSVAETNVHGEKGNMKIPDSKNKPHPVSFVGERSDYPSPARTLHGHIPDSRNKGAGY